ncbi:MAG: AMP-binding protein [Rhodospirillales bacterium]
MNDAATGSANSGHWPNLPAMFFTKAGTLAGRPFLWAKPRGGEYDPLTWKEVSDKVTALSKGLLALDVKPGDRVGLVAENCPEWLIADVSIMTVGALAVPAYTTNTVDDHAHVLSDSGASGVIVSTAKLAEKVIAAASDCPDLRFVVCIEDLGTGHGARDGLEILTWDTAVERGAGQSEDIPAMAAKWRRTDTACLIYTSGTGGAPKGVMLSHGAVLQNVESVCKIIEPVGVENNVFLSFLPLSHSYEHMAGQFFPIILGAEIYYAEGVETLLTNLAEAKPTLMTAVPRAAKTSCRAIGISRQARPKQSRTAGCTPATSASSMKTAI